MDRSAGQGMAVDGRAGLSAASARATATTAQRAAPMPAGQPKADREFEQFLYILGHDLREPAGIISSYAELLAGQYGHLLDERGQRFLGHIADTASTLQRRLWCLLTYARLSGEGGPFLPTDLAIPLLDALTRLQPTIAATGGTVTAGPLPSVPVDSRQMVLVFEHLIDNALKYGADGSGGATVTLSAAREGANWRISVRDRGSGIDPGQQGRLFDLFQRLHTAAEQAGDGAGLSFCRRVIERHGGRIWLESQPGEGTTVSFTLPARRDGDAE